MATLYPYSEHVHLPAQDFFACMPMLKRYYNDNYHMLTGSINRSDEVWRFIKAKVELSNGLSRLLRVEYDRSLIGYIGTTGNNMVEASIEAGAVPLIPAILSELGIKSMRLHPEHPILRHCRNSYNTTVKERFAINGGYMIKLLSPRRVLKKLLPRIKMRLNLLKYTTSKITLLGLEVDVETGQVTPTNARKDIDFTDKNYAVQMLLGFLPPRNIQGLTVINDKSSPGIIFPELNFHTSELDEV